MRVQNQDKNKQGKGAAGGSDAGHLGQSSGSTCQHPVDAFHNLSMGIKIMKHLVEGNFADICAYRRMGFLEDCDTMEDLLAEQADRLADLAKEFEAKLSFAR